MSEKRVGDGPILVVIALTVAVMSMMFIGPITIDLMEKPTNDVLLLLWVFSVFGTAISLTAYWGLIVPFILAFVVDWHRRRVDDGWGPSIAYLLVPLAAVMSIPMLPTPGSGEALLFTPIGGALYLHRRAVHVGTPRFAAPGFLQAFRTLIDELRQRY